MSGELLENIKTLEGQQSGNPGEFERLVERLARVFDDAADEYAERQESPHFRETLAGIRAVLAELTKLGVDDALPSEGAIAAELWETAFPIVGKCDWRPCANKMREALAATVSPVLAAKDAELARRAEEIERLRAEAMPTDEQLAEEAARFAYNPQWWDLAATAAQREWATGKAMQVVRTKDAMAASSVFEEVARIYASGARRDGRMAADQIATEAPSMNITHPDD